jgi:hypothetical protein
VANSILEAIKLGVWDFEPKTVDETKYHATEAVPGSREKLSVLAERVALGLPLWHGSDRQDYEDSDDELRE